MAFRALPDRATTPSTVDNPDERNGDHQSTPQQSHGARTNDVKGFLSAEHQRTSANAHGTAQPAVPKLAKVNNDPKTGDNWFDEELR